MSAQQDRIDREMLRSMAASFSSGLGFSFNSHDMAELMQRMSERIDPKPLSVDPFDPQKVRMAEALESIVQQAAIAEDPDHHTLSLCKEIARAALRDMGATP